jgi:hypothetical protein
LAKFRRIYPNNYRHDRPDRLNAHLAQEVREAGITFTLDDLDHRFKELFKHLEDSGACRRGEDVTPIVTKELWLQGQWATIQRLARGEAL